MSAAHLSAFGRWSRASRPALWLVMLCLVGLAGCATPPPPPSKIRVVLLPQKDATGQPIQTAVDLQSEGQALTLDKPLAVAEFDGKGKLAQRIATADEIQARYGDVLKIQPPSPEKFVLRFLPGKSQLTPESESQLPQIIERAKARAGGEILVVGHTDRVGTVAANDRLSAQRALVIVELLKAQGFSADLLTAIGRGEREPAVPTEDEVAEPRNRRAEIIIR